MQLAHSKNSRLMGCLLVCMVTTALAEPLPYMADNYWCCIVSDSENKAWTEYSTYQLAASSRASEDCKKQSKDPLSCKITKNSCEHFIHGISTRPLWRCVAFDRHAKRWPSDLKTNREAAASSGEEQCRQHSSIPETCYVNLITCRNLNPVSE